MSETGSRRKAVLLEAYHATVPLLPASLLLQLPVIGGVSLVMLGHTYRQEPGC